MPSIYTCAERRRSRAPPRHPFRAMRPPAREATLGGTSTLTTLIDPFGIWRRAGAVAADRAADGLVALLERALATPQAERAVRTLVEGPLVDVAVRSAVEAQLVEHVAAELERSGEIDRIVAGVLRSEELWRVVDEIVQSPTVTAAIRGQGMSFADQVGDEIGERSRRADDRLDRFARRLLHRHPTPVAPATP
jgi:hypothetical protein